MSIQEFQDFFYTSINRQGNSGGATINPCANGSMPVYNPPPMVEPWETEVFDNIRSCLNIVRSGMTITEVFRRLDIANTNTLSPYEFQRMVLTYHPNLSQAHVDQLFRKINTSGSGNIVLGEFTRRFG